MKTDFSGTCMIGAQASETRVIAWLNELRRNRIGNSGSLPEVWEVWKR